MDTCQSAIGFHGVSKLSVTYLPKHWALFLSAVRKLANRYKSCKSDPVEFLHVLRLKCVVFVKIGSKFS